MLNRLLSIVNPNAFELNDCSRTPNFLVFQKIHILLKVYSSIHIITACKSTTLTGNDFGYKSLQCYSITTISFKKY